MRKALLITAHPDDESLWAGGFLLQHLEWEWVLIVLCRADDPDRAPRFHHLLAHLGARGFIASLDDGPEQIPLNIQEVERTILNLVPQSVNFDVCLTHGPAGEYTRHLRHIETSQAVLSLWASGLLQARELWMFAYQDGGGLALPSAHPLAHQVVDLDQDVWEQKYQLVTGIYGFDPESWEARTTPRKEAFWRFYDPQAALEWVRMPPGLGIG
jgi:LmbE family N-acetylglucosaminyl deacetylase